MLPLILVALAPTWAGTTPSKYTADHYLISPKDYEGTNIALDVVAVKPVHFQSPIPGIQFFHAMTFDERNHAPGGAILVAISGSDNVAFAKKYGTTIEGGRRMLHLAKTTRLQGTLIAAKPIRHMPPGMRKRMEETQVSGTTSESGTSSTETGSDTETTPAPRRMMHGPGGIWLVDYEGKCADIIKAYMQAHKQEVLQLPADAAEPQGGPGEGGPL